MINDQGTELLQKAMAKALLGKKHKVQMISRKEFLELQKEDRRRRNQND